MGGYNVTRQATSLVCCQGTLGQMLNGLPGAREFLKLTRLAGIPAVSQLASTLGQFLSPKFRFCVNIMEETLTLLRSS